MVTGFREVQSRVSFLEERSVLDQLFSQYNYVHIKVAEDKLQFLEPRQQRNLATLWTDSLGHGS